MSEPVKEILALELPCDAQAPRVVREALHELDWLGWVLGDVTLVASELVANAVTHSGCGGRETLLVRVELAGDRLRIAVRDPGRSGDSAHIRGGDDGEPGGWGLLIVDQLAREWGAERGDGHIVWADVALPVPEASADTGGDGAPARRSAAESSG